MCDWRVEGGGLHWYVACADGCLAGPDETTQRCHPKRQAKQEWKANSKFPAMKLPQMDRRDFQRGGSRKESGDRRAQELEAVCCNLLFRLGASRLASVEESGPLSGPSPTSHVRAIVEISHDKRLLIDYAVRVINASQRPAPSMVHSHTTML